jgi:hypothetical protein
MFPFNDEFDINSQFDMAKFADNHIKQENKYIPGDIYSSTRKVAADLILLSLYRVESSSFYIKKMSESMGEKSPEDYGAGVSTYENILAQLCLGEEKSVVTNRTLLKYSSRVGQGQLTWAYFFYALSHERCLGRFGLNWLQLVPSIDTATMPASCDYKDVLKNAVNEMVEAIHNNCGKDNSFMNRVDAALLSIELELGLGIRRVDTYQTA